MNATQMNTLDRWEKIEDLFHAALERAPGERDSFLAAVCGADADLRSQVEALLRAHSRDENIANGAPTGASLVLS
jgi:hypothetical protein